MDVLFENLERCREDDDMHLLKAREILRQDLFGSNNLFNGRFDYSSQESSVPKSLFVLLRMTVEGININSEPSYAANHAALSLAQLIEFNSVKRKGRETVICRRHTLSRETPLLVYLGLMVHSKIRMKLGLSITYNRISEIQELVMKQEVEQFDEIGLVCPKNLNPKIFTTAAIDKHRPQFDFINCIKPLSWDARFSTSIFC